MATAGEHNRRRTRTLSTAVGDLDQKSTAARLGDGFAAFVTRQHHSATVIGLDFGVFIDDVVGQTRRRSRRGHRNPRRPLCKAESKHAEEKREISRSEREENGEKFEFKFDRVIESG